jgi:hypothetical protein
MQALQSVGLHQVVACFIEVLHAIQPLLKIAQLAPLQNIRANGNNYLRSFGHATDSTTAAQAAFSLISNNGPRPVE